MAGNRDAYQHYMNSGHNAAWDQNWRVAIKAYTQAIQELPEDPEAHIHLGLALLKEGRLEDALKVYSRAHQLAPDDPVPLEKSADVLERMGRLKEAAQQYINVSDVYLSMRDLDKAIGNWERATQLTPGLISIHAKLAQAYERIGDKKKAVREYLMLAFNFQRMKDTEKAIKAVERALRLDKRNPQVLNTYNALKRGGDVILPDDDRDKNKRNIKEEFDIFGSGASNEAQRAKVGEADPMGPVGEAMSEALVALAAYVVESGELDAAGGEAMAAMEYQRQEVYEPAITAYQRAESRLRHPALKLNLGALLLLNDRPAEAVKHLGEAVMDPKLAAGALHGMGQAFHRQRKFKQAARYLIQSLQAVDTSLAVNMEESAELADVYSRLMNGLDRLSEDALAATNERFMNLLSGKDWKQRIAETRRHLEEVMRDEGDEGAFDVLTTGGDQLPAIVSRIDTYIRQGFLTLAMDEAHRAVETSPFYLPVHVRMAEIMMREGRVRQAINKYNTVARSYMVRGENDRAASILGEVLEMAPLDISVRNSLIELLEQENRMAEALDQYIELARTYNQLGNFDLARETYSSAERLARRIGAPAEKMAKIKHNLADMDLTRLDTRRAMKTYEEIIELIPEDELAYRKLIDLNYNQGNQVEAIRRLDRLLSIYAKKKQINRMTQILEEMVKHYPGDTGLRKRMGDLYRQLNRKGDAIAQYDALGELQLEAGMIQDARNTIKQIISLKPDGIDEYRRLLQQLGG
ncbi:MAG: tetratricopeptide repeat protein [bacterium]|nr:tetratricopeptide repeat protein [bacterium]